MAQGSAICSIARMRAGVIRVEWNHGGTGAHHAHHHRHQFG